MGHTIIAFRPHQVYKQMIQFTRSSTPIAFFPPSQPLGITGENKSGAQIYSPWMDGLYMLAMQNNFWLVRRSVMSYNQQPSLRLSHVDMLHISFNHYPENEGQERGNTFARDLDLQTSLRHCFTVNPPSFSRNVLHRRSLPSRVHRCRRYRPFIELLS